MLHRDRQVKSSLHVVKSVSQSSISRTRPALTLHRLAVRLRHSRSNTSTEYSLPGATQLSQVRSISPSGQGGCSLSLLPCTKESMVERRKPNKYSKATRRREVPTGGLAALARPDWSRARTPLAHAPRPTTPSRHQPPADILAALCGTGSRPSTGQSPERAR